MTVASDARAAIRRQPFLHAALRAGVLNYTAAARYLDVGEEEAVAAALRRYGEGLSSPDSRAGTARVNMRSGVGPTDDDPLLTIGALSLGPDGGDETAIVATGDVTTTELGAVLARLAVEDIVPTAAGGTDGQLVVVVGRREGIDALRYVEETLDG